MQVNWFPVCCGRHKNQQLHGCGAVAGVVLVLAGAVVEAGFFFFRFAAVDVEGPSLTTMDFGGGGGAAVAALRAVRRWTSSASCD